MNPEYENGILVGHYGKSFGPDGKERTVFIPRRERDIQNDRDLADNDAQRHAGLPPLNRR